MHDANTIMRTGNVRSFHIASTGFACPARNYLYACCVKLLRWLFKPIDQLLDRVFSVAGAVVLSQMPQIMRQYLDVLSGALAEAGRNVAVFRDQAFLLGKSLPEFIDKHLRNPDPAGAAPLLVSAEPSTLGGYRIEGLGSTKAAPRPARGLAFRDASVGLPLFTEGQKKAFTSYGKKC